MNIDDLLEKWNAVNEDIRKAQRKVEKYKQAMNENMNQKNLDKIEGKEYAIHRRRITKLTVTKANLPKELWDRYSTRCTFDAYYLKKIR